MRIGLRKNRRALQQRLGLCGDGTRHRNKNPVNLALLFIQQTRQLIIVLDSLHRLDKHRLATRTRPMHDAADLALELNLHRNHKAFAAHSDQRILRAAIFGQLRQGASQTGLNRSVLMLQRAANAPQLRRGIIAQAAIRLNLSAQRAQQIREIVLHERRRQLLHPRPLRTHRIRRRKDHLPPGLNALRMHNHRAEFDSLQRCALNPRLFKRLSHIEDSAEVEAATSNQPLHLGIALLLFTNPNRLGTRSQRADPLPAQRRLGATRQVFDQLGPLQGLGADLRQRSRDLRKECHTL